MRQSAPAASVIARGAKVEKLADGFFNISGGATGPGRGFLFCGRAPAANLSLVDAAARQLSTVNDAPLDPVNLAADKAGNLLGVSYAGSGVVYGLSASGAFLPLKPEAVAQRTGKIFYLPVSDWHLNQDSLSHPAAQFVSPDGTTVLPVGQDFLDGATSWGVKSSPPIRAFGLGPAVPGRPFYVTDESALRTWVAEVHADGSLGNFHSLRNKVEKG